MHNVQASYVFFGVKNVDTVLGLSLSFLLNDIRDIFYHD